MYDSNSAEETPLTFAQRAQLLVECLPVVFFSLALIFVLTWFGELTGSRPSLFLVVFLCALIVIMAWVAVHRIPRPAIRRCADARRCA